MRDRPRPLLLALALVLAVVVPAVVAAVTGLADGHADGYAETASTAGGGGGGHRAGTPGDEPDGEQPQPGGGRHLVGDGPGMTSASPTTTAASIPPTTVGTVPSTTAPPPPPPPSTAPPPTAPPAPPPPVVPPTDQVVALANLARAEEGCPALRIDDRLVAAAQAHSDDMGANDYFSHDSLDGRTFADRIEAAGYPSPGGENIARGQRDAQAVHDAWMQSSGHRANILNCEFTAIGVGLHEATWTWTQDFGY